METRIERGRILESASGSPSPSRSFYKTTQIARPSEKFVWAEENDPRGENLGSWKMNQAGTMANGFAGSTFIDSPAATFDSDQHQSL